MAAFLLLIACPLLGFGFARFRLMPEGAVPVLNAWLLRVALPALILELIPRLAPEPGLFIAALAPWIVMAGAALVIPLVGRRLGWERGTIGALVLTCGLGNTAFIGLPMILALAGPGALGAAVIADQLGSFLALCTAGVALASIWAGDRIEPREIGERLLRFPPFPALIIGLVVRTFGGWPEPVSVVLHRLGDSLTPIALFTVGLQFQLRALHGRWQPLAVGLGWKLVVAPLAVLIVAMLSGAAGLPAQAGILQAAQGPMITAGILAQEHRLDPELVTLVVGVGILLSFVTAPLWFLLIR